MKSMKWFFFGLGGLGLMGLAFPIGLYNPLLGFLLLGIGSIIAIFAGVLGLGED